MATTLPPDPYSALGVSKEATVAEIRSAHRKLVLKCHPDKVQDPELKAVKQDEFQRVQQAYELLSDDNRRTQYHELVKLHELRKQMGRGNPTARSNPFEYEVRTAEPRTSTKEAPKSSSKVYSRPPPRSYEDFIYEEPIRAGPRPSKSYEYTDRKSPRTKEDERERDRRRHEDDERVRQKAEKESKRSVHSEKKKSRDKERRSGKEEKNRVRTTYVETATDSDEYRSPQTRSASEKKSSRHKIEEDIRMREEAARAQEAARAHLAAAREPARATIKSAPLDPKWNQHMERAGEYMQAAKRKVEDNLSHPGMRRAETFTTTSPTYNIRYATPTKDFSDDDSPRRSSARRETRRSSDTPSPRTHEKSSSKSTRRSPTAHADAYVVEPPSPPPSKPSLQTHSSAPPILPIYNREGREKPVRSKTGDYPRNERDAVPPLPRAHTFQSGDRGPDRGRERGGSRLKKQVDYTSSSSDSDEQVYTRQRYSPQRRPAAPEREPTRYIIDNGRSVPITKSHGPHRSEMRNIDDADYAQTRDRSESPRGASRRSQERPRPMATRSQSQAYYAPEAPDPVILTARPKISRESSGSVRRAGPSNGGTFFGEVKYAPQYTPEHVIYTANSPAGHYRGASESSHGHHRDYGYPTRSRGEQVYAAS